MKVYTADTMVFTGIKMLVSGDTGTGKSYFAQTVPNSFVVDSEAGTGYYAFKGVDIGGKRYQNAKYVGQSVNYEDLEAKLDELIAGEIDVDTLVIDSESRFYSSLVAASEDYRKRDARLNGKNYNELGTWKDVKRIHDKLQLAKITASMKGYRIISIVQAQEQKVKNPITGEDEVIWKLSAHKSIGFDYDVHIKMFTKENPKTQETEYFCEVLKDRTGTYKKGAIIKNPTYKHWEKNAENHEGRPVSDANFIEDNKANIDYVKSDAEKTETLSKELVEALKEVPKEKREEAQAKLKELKIDIRRMTESTSDTLAEAVEAIKSL